MRKLKEAYKAEKYFVWGTGLLVAAWVVSTFLKDDVDSRIENFHYYQNAASINFNALATNEHTLFSVLNSSKATRYDSIKGYANSLMNSSNMLTLTAKALNDTTGEYLPKAENGIPMIDVQGAVYWLVEQKNLEELRELYTYLSRVQTPLYLKASQDSSRYLKELHSKKSFYNNIILVLIILGTLSINYDKFTKYMKKSATSPSR